MRAGTVTVGLLVCADLELGDMGDQDVVGQLELDVLAPAPALGPVMQVEMVEIGDKIGLPNFLAAVGARVQCARLVEVVVLTVEAIGKVEGTVKEELLVAEHVHQQRRGRHRQQSGRLLPRPVVQPVEGVQRNCKEASCLPFK